MPLNLRGRLQKPWSWRTIGLLQLVNAVAFGAVAVTADFPGNARGGQLVAATSETSTPPTTDETTTDATTTVPVVATDDSSDSSPPSDTAVNVNPDATVPPLFIEPASPAADPASSTSANEDQARPIEPPAVASAIAAPVIVNPASNALAVRFVVNGELVALQPGERRALAGGDMWIVRFHRGGEFGAALEPIYDGTHQFVIGPQGWRLERSDRTP